MAESPMFEEPDIEGVSLFSTGEEDTPSESIFQDDAPQTGTMSPERAQVKAKKWHVALGDESPGVDQIVSSFNSGTGKIINEQAQINDRTADLEVRAKTIDNYFEYLGHDPLAELDTEYVKGLSTPRPVAMMNDNFLDEKFISSVGVNAAATDSINNPVEDTAEGDAVIDYILDTSKDQVRRYVNVQEQLSKLHEEFLALPLTNKLFNTGLSMLVIPGQVNTAINTAESVKDQGLSSARLTLKGEYLEGIKSKYYSEKDPEKAIEFLNRTLDQIKQFNLNDAYAVAEYVLLGGDFERAWANFESSFSVATKITGAHQLMALRRAWGVRRAMAAASKVNPNEVAVTTATDPAQATVKATAVKVQPTIRKIFDPANENNPEIQVAAREADSQSYRTSFPANENSILARSINDSSPSTLKTLTPDNDSGLSFKAPTEAADGSLVSEVGVAKGKTETALVRKSGRPEASDDFYKNLTPANANEDTTLGAVVNRPAAMSKQLARKLVADNDIVDQVTGDIKPAGVPRLTLDRNLVPANDLEHRLAIETPEAVNPYKALGQVSDNLDVPFNGANYLLKSSAAEDFIQILTNNLRVSRIDPTGSHMTNAIADAMDKFQKRHLTNNDPIISSRYVENYSNKENVHYLDIDLGPSKRSLFPSQASAKAMAEDVWGFLPNGYTIVPEGNSFKVRVRKALDESATLTHDGLKLDIDNSEKPGSIRTFLNGVIGAKNFLPSNISKEQEAASSLTSFYTKAFQRIAEPLNAGKLRKEHRENLTRIFIKDREMERWLDTPQDLRAEYTAMFNRPPTSAEEAAYFAYRELYDTEHLVNNLAQRRDNLRLGVESFSVRLSDELTLNNVHAKFLDKFPDHDPTRFPSRVLTIDKKGALEYKSTQFLDSTEGLQIIQLTSQGKQAFKTAVKDVEDLSEIPDYIVLSKSRFKSGPISDMLAYRKGGHRFPAAVEHIAQPNVNKSTGPNNLNPRVYYHGDTKLLGFEAPGVAGKFIDDFNAGRQIVKNIHAGSMVDADLNTFLVGSRLPYAVKEFKKLFEHFGGEFKLDTPFGVVKNNRKLLKDGDYADFGGRAEIVDNAKSPHILETDEVSARYAQERGIDYLTIDTTGDTNVLRSIDRINPIDALNISLRNVTGGLAMDDIKIKMATHLINEYGHLLDVPFDELRRNPMGALANPKWKDTRSMAPDAVLGRAFARSARHYAAYESDVSSFVKAAGEVGAEFLYRNNIVSEAGSKTVLNASKTLSKLPTEVRKAVTMAYLGFANVAQLFIQASGAGHVIAMEPFHATKALGFATLDVLSRAGGSKISASLSKVTGISAREYNQMWKSFNDSGWSIVDANHSLISAGGQDDVFKVAEDWKKGLLGRSYDFVQEKGRMPFNGGERFAKAAAWGAAWQRFKKDNPLADMTHPDSVKSVLARATQYAGNMTQASRSSLDNTLSLPLQFTQYVNRINEQILFGNRDISLGQRARAASMYALLYGVPSAGAIGGSYYGLFDAHKWWKGYLEENEIQMDDEKVEGFVNKVVQKGVVKTGIDAAVGANTDADTRFSPFAGPLFIHDLLSGDKDTFDLLAGATNTKLAHVTKALNPMARHLASLLNLTEREFPMTVSDYMRELAPLTTTTNNLLQLYMIGNAKKAMTRNGTYMDDVSFNEMLSKTLTGVGPQRTTDLYDIMSDEKLHKGALNVLRPRIQEEFRRFADHTLSEKDRENSWKRLQVYFDSANLTPRERHMEVTRASKANIISSANKLWLLQAERNSYKKRVD